MVLLLSILGSLLLGFDYISPFMEMVEWLKLFLSTLNMAVLLFCVFKLLARKHLRGRE